MRHHKVSFRVSISWRLRILMVFPYFQRFVKLQICYQDFLEFASLLLTLAGHKVL